MKKNKFRSISACRNAVAAEFKRCCADEHTKMVLGAKLAVWDEVVAYARLTNYSNGAPAVRLLKHLRNKAGEDKSYALIATDDKAQYVSFSKDADAITARKEAFEEAMRLVA